MKTSVYALFLCLAAVSAQAIADAPGTRGGRTMTVATATAERLSEGLVRKVDVAAGKLTLKHGPLANLAMPPMTMAFRVRDAALLKGLKVGDAVRFRAEEIEGVLTVTLLEASR